LSFFEYKKHPLILKLAGVFILKVVVFICYEL
jgi:hypothetical protein